MKVLSFKELDKLGSLILRLDQEQGLSMAAIEELELCILDSKNKLRKSLKKTYNMGNLFSNTEGEKPAYFKDNQD